MMLETSSPCRDTRGWLAFCGGSRAALPAHALAFAMRHAGYYRPPGAEYAGLCVRCTGDTASPTESER